MSTYLKCEIMENSRALHGIHHILAKLQDEELLSLAGTVTQGLLKNKLETREEAIEAVLKYSTSLYSVLRRKVVTRDILFAYLHENDVSVKLPTTKNDLVDIICAYWSLKPDAVTLTQSVTPKTQSHYDTVPQVTTMALKFSEWFYTMMNSNEPIGPEHFWKDAKLKLNLISGMQNVTEEIDDSPQEIVQLLYKTKCEHKLYFNPNFLSDGIQGRMDPHGLVVVLCCGTLHSSNACVGVFEQVFMLARDPYVENNWKIKKTELNLKSKEGVSAPPSLCDSSLTSNLLALPIS